MSGKTVTPSTLQEPVKSIQKLASCEENNRVVLNESSSGKILIEVSLSRQNVHEYEITQIIKEIFALNNHDMEVEKVVMPIGQDTWQIRRANIDNIIGSESNLKNKKPKSMQQSGVKLINHKKLYRLEPQNLNKLKHRLRKKLTEKSLLEETLTRTVSEVHSSTAVTNLLSQLYPNPYNLLNLMEIEDVPEETESKGTVNMSNSVKIKFKTDNALSTKEGLIVREIPEKNESSAVVSTATTEADPDIIHKDPKITDTKKEKEEMKPVTLFDQSGTDHKPEKMTCRKVKRMRIPSDDHLLPISEDKVSDSPAGTKKHELQQREAKTRNKSNIPVHEVSNGTADEKSKITSMEPKVLKKVSRPSDPGKVHEKVPSKKRGVEKSSVSVIHPLSLPKASPPEEDKGTKHALALEVKMLEDKNVNVGKKAKLETEKDKCVVQYLKLIKDMYEAEERDLQSKIDDAWSHMLCPDKLSKRRVKAKAPQRTLRVFSGRMNDKTWTKCAVHSTMSGRRGRIIDKKAVVDQPRSLQMALCETVPRQMLTPRTESLYTWMDYNPLKSQLNIGSNITPIPCSQATLVQRDMPTFKRKNISNDMNPLPVEVLTRNVYETDKKIDLLIRHIENSMNRLSQSEESSSLRALMVNPYDLTMENNFQAFNTGLPPVPEDTAYLQISSGKRNNLLINQSFHSLRFFPTDNGNKNVKIRSDTLLPFSFSKEISGRNREYVWWQANMIKSTSVGEIENDHLGNRSIDYADPAPGPSDTQPIRERTERETIEGDRNEIGEVTYRNSVIDFEVPEIPLTSAPVMVSVESSNELGSYIEVENEPERSPSSESIRIRRTRDPSRISLTDVKTLLEAEETFINQAKNSLEVGRSHPSSLSISIVELGEELSSLKPVVVQEITWNFYLPMPTPVTHVHYRSERNLMFERKEPQVLYVATPTLYSDLAKGNLVQIVDQKQKQYSSVIISLEKCSAFTGTDNEQYDSRENSEFVANFKGDDNGDALPEEDATDVKILKSAESLACRKQGEHSDSFPSESSTEICDSDKRSIRMILRREESMSRKLNRCTENLPWLHPLPDPYESNPPEEDTDSGDGNKVKTDHCSNKAPKQLKNSWGDFLPDLRRWNNRKVQISSFTPHLFRYISSDASMASVNDTKVCDTLEKTGELTSSPKTDVLVSHEVINGSESKQKQKQDLELNPEMKENSQKQDQDKDSSSTSSFKSSIDCSDISELENLNNSKKKSMFQSYLLNKLFHELRYFRKTLHKRKSLKRKPSSEDKKECRNELSEVVEERKALVRDVKKMEEGTAVNALCIGEVTVGDNHADPRKIFKTSFRGKESVTELMIDLKDVCMSEISDISVEKRKLSSDHTKISIIIKKQGDGNGDRFCTDTCLRGNVIVSSPRSSYHSLHETDGLRRKDKGDSGSEGSDEEDYFSADSSIGSMSSESIPDDEFKKLMYDDLEEPGRRTDTFRRHRFDYYKKMDNVSSLNSIDFNRKGILTSGVYETELAPLKKALTDMQLRIRNIQQNSYFTSEEYHERALRMAKMSAGYCQSCKSKAVIPEDPLGIYRKYVPQSWVRNPFGKRREYYFRTTSSTNSSFYSVQSSNSHNSNKFCRLNSSSSLYTNGVHRSGRTPLKETSNTPGPFFLSPNINF